MKVWRKNTPKKKVENQLEIFYPNLHKDESELPFFDKNKREFTKKNNAVSGPLSRAMNPYMDIYDIIHNHSVFCQISLPYKEIKGKSYTRKNGNLILTLESMLEGSKGTSPGLPYGPMSRLLIIYINSYAVQHKTQIIDTMRSMNDFITKDLNISRNGRNFKVVRNQLERLRQTNIEFNYENSDRYTTYNTRFISAYDFNKKNDNCFIKLETDYYNSLIESAVPLDVIALQALSNNSMALDIYAWLAHRLHRIEKPTQFIPFTQLKNQFGHNFKHMYHFKNDFRYNLDLALRFYEAAQGKVSEQPNKGLILRPCRPPIDKAVYAVKKQ
jgi:hypothetical protein